MFKDLKENFKKINFKDTNKKKNNLEMVFVEGGKYRPSFFENYPELEGKEGEVFDIEVSKYLTTQEMYKNIMKKNPSKFKGEKNPAENMTWWDALEYCNKLSKKEGLRPVYNINEDKNSETCLTSVDKCKNLKINQLDGEAVSPDKADFRKTEGYRLPTELEWEWFARGGNVAKQKGTFDNEYLGSDNIDEIAWYKDNSEKKTHAVGTKKANELGLYDCLGNVWEMCYDTADEESIYIQNSESNTYIYGISNIYNASFRRLRGGCCTSPYEFFGRIWCLTTLSNGKVGFRVVRTV